MKTCPVCHAVAFDDAQVCYGCLYRFKEDDLPDPPAAGVRRDSHTAFAADADLTGKNVAVKAKVPLSEGFADVFEAVGGAGGAGCGSESGRAGSDGENGGSRTASSPTGAASGGFFPSSPAAVPACGSGVAVAASMPQASSTDGWTMRIEFHGPAVPSGLSSAAAPFSGEAVPRFALTEEGFTMSLGKTESASGGTGASARHRESATSRAVLRHRRQRAHAAGAGAPRPAAR